MKYLFRNNYKKLSHEDLKDIKDELKTQYTEWYNAQNDGWNQTRFEEVVKRNMIKQERASWIDGG